MKVILKKILNNFVHEAKFYGMEFSTYGAMSVLNMF
jgi:hypothetical protein